MSDEELIALHDKQAGSATASVSYYLDEISRRETRRQTAIIVWFTIAIFALTVVVALSTVLLLLRPG